MSQIARIFVVLNLVLSAGFLFSAGTFLGVKADWIKKHGEEVDGRKKDNAEKDRTIVQNQAQVGDLTSQNTALKTELAKLETKAGEQKNRIETLEAENAAKNAQIQGLTKDVESALDVARRGQDEIRRLTDKNSDLDKGISAAQKSEQEAKAAETVAKSTIVERENAIKDLEIVKATLEKAGREKDLIIDFAKEQGVDIGRALKMEPVEGRVLAVDAGLKLVQFNFGSNQKVARGYTIDVVRGAQYIGRVRIDQVYGDMCAGTLIVSNGNEMPTVGDRGLNTL